MPRAVWLAPRRASSRSFTVHGENVSLTEKKNACDVSNELKPHLYGSWSVEKRSWNPLSALAVVDFCAWDRVLRVDAIAKHQHPIKSSTTFICSCNTIVMFKFDFYSVTEEESDKQGVTCTGGSSSPTTAAAPNVNLAQQQPSTSNSAAPLARRMDPGDITGVSYVGKLENSSSAPCFNLFDKVMVMISR